MSSSPPLRLLALGDSYTIGEAVDETDRWPTLLAERLRADGRAVAPPTLVAETGWTADELESALDAAALDPPYDLVTLLIGVNNQYRGLGVATYRPTLRRLIGRAVELAGGAPRRVLALSIPDWGATPFADGRNRACIAAEIGRFNAVVRAEARRTGVGYVDVTSISRSVVHDPSLLAEDGLHPSRPLYRRWVERIFPAARAVLGLPT